MLTMAGCAGRKAEIQHRLKQYLECGTVPMWSLEKLEGTINRVYDSNYPRLDPAAGSVSPGTKLSSYDAYLPTKEAVASQSNQVVQDTPGQVKKTVRCICLNNGTLPNMVQCENDGCGVWQHWECVRPNGGIRKGFMCEECRLLLADPFWKPVESILPTGIMKQIPGMPPIRDLKGNMHARISLEQTFFLTQQQLRPCVSDQSKRRVLISCIQMEDDTPCRIHWPKNISMRINNLTMRPYTRSLSSNIGINQRDSAVNATMNVVSGRNMLKISAVENFTWVVMVYIAEKQSHEDVKRLMMAPETKEEAKARMKKLLAGDSEGAIGLEQMTLSLKDPMTCTRISVPARFSNASGPQAFDLDSFLSIADLNRKWQDPTTLKNSTVKQLQEDTYVKVLLDNLASMPDINSIEVNATGDWRPEGLEDTWFDICQELGQEDLIKLQERFGRVKNEEHNNNDDTEVYDGVLDVDEKEEALEAVSALISVRGEDNVDQSQPPTTVGKKRQSPVEVIELLSSDDD